MDVMVTLFLSTVHKENNIYAENYLVTNLLWQIENSTSLTANLNVLLNFESSTFIVLKLNSILTFLEPAGSPPGDTAATSTYLSAAVGESQMSKSFGTAKNLSLGRLRTLSL